MVNSIERLKEKTIYVKAWIYEVDMEISYDKLWVLLDNRKTSCAELRKSANIAPNTMTKLRKNEIVSMSILLKIANYLDCDISDICEFVKSK